MPRGETATDAGPGAIFRDGDAALRSDQVEEAARRLGGGELVVHPTESVYGFGCLLAPEPLAALRELKDRPSGGFVVLLPRPQDADRLLGQAGRALARAFWPGPLTLVVDDPEDRFHPHAKASDGSVALRVPGHPTALALLAAAAAPLTSTSANAPGARPAATAQEARQAALARGRDLFALDAGPLPGGAPSTIVRAGNAGPALLRAGPIAPGALSEAVGAPVLPA